MAGGPTYHRIADLLREEIRTGKWKPGDRLPSHTQPAEQIQVSIATARNAIHVLGAEILSIQRIPAARSSETRKYSSR
ncbi:GntR family transcriptional regulator [Nocardia sp. R6R-6]|uniref:GntR family transcriptional regulator n=1 Tax=Nocardia sp. R6R-6 TaxID=3459303 RepID=UPI00403E0D81